jgi:hypothetical protein
MPSIKRGPRKPAPRAYIKVSQGTIDKIKGMGMQAALKKASRTSTSGDFVEGVKRMYGARRLTAAKMKRADSRIQKPSLSKSRLNVQVLLLLKREHQWQKQKATPKVHIKESKANGSWWFKAWCTWFLKEQIRKIMKQRKAFWDKKNPKKKSKKLTSSQKAAAKRRAKAAGRPYPNLVDNAAVSRRKGK